jgi:transcriptional regulator with XRE-family HTH domain
MASEGFTKFDTLFAEHFRIARRSLNVSQETVAEEMTQRGYSLHVTAVGKIERGDRRVSIGEAAALADILGLPLDLLLGGEVTLQSALSVHQQERRKLTNEVHSYVQTLLAIAAAADKADALSPAEREWLTVDLPRQTPARMTSDANIALEAAISREGVFADGTFVTLLRDQVRRDSELNSPAGADG